MESELKKASHFFSIISTILAGFLINSCETEFIPTNINLDPEIVVEGYIELADDALPPYVLLTSSRPFFNTINQSQLNDIFIHDADVQILYDSQTTKLQELCLNDLPPALKSQVAIRLGIDPDSVKTNLCVYVDINGIVKPMVGKSYNLKIKSGSQIIEATTTIPAYVPLDSLWWKEAPGTPSDTLLQLEVIIHDPFGEMNFYRYFCKLNDGQFLTPFNSVYDDPLINGKEFEFNLVRPNNTGEKFNQSTFGLFHIGDSVCVKWATIDKAHFNFWNTYEFNKGSQGPFSTYTTIDSNIKGGLGVWGGYHSKTYRLKVKR